MWHRVYDEGILSVGFLYINALEKILNGCLRVHGALVMATFEKDIALTILNQIEQTYNGTVVFGKGEAQRMSALRLIGAKDFVYGSNFVQFIVQGPRDFNKIKVILNAKDLYDVELWNVRVGPEPHYVLCEKVDEYNNVFFEELGNLLVREVCYK